MEDADVIENFYGVYLLYCLNPRYKGRTYIGYTVDPNRRIKQHNQGIKSGGASRTNNKGPWKMVLIVHGFPNDISALRFEWAWTYPHKSRRLNNIQKKRTKETKFDFCLRVLSVMLQSNPWTRLPLTVRWLDQEFHRDFESGVEPPLHMPITFGVVKPVKVRETLEKEISVIYKCFICHKNIDSVDIMRCLAPSCDMKSHIFCLSKYMLSDDSEKQLLPLEGHCPKCKQSLLWGDIIKCKNGCYQSHAESTYDWVNISLSQV